MSWQTIKLRVSTTTYRYNLKNLLSDQNFYKILSASKSHYLLSVSKYHIWPISFQIFLFCFRILIFQLKDSIFFTKQSWQWRVRVGVGVKRVLKWRIFQKLCKNISILQNILFWTFYFPQRHEHSAKNFFGKTKTFYLSIRPIIEV